MVDLENNNLNISLLAEENISSSLISENLQVIFDTSTNISVKPALSYIKSGQKEISDYVSNVAEPRLSEYAQTAENQMQNCVNAVQKFADDIVDKGFVKTADLQNALEGKQDVISDLPAIRNGATLGATAVQPADLASVATSGSYNDLSNKPNLDAKANIDLLNLTNTGKNIANWSTNVTNCITEIPQDIKLELNNGTLTLKAGSTYYKCDGSFTKVTTSQDYSKTNVSNGYRLVFFTGNGFDIPLVQDCNSGTSEPTRGSKWFNTSNYILYSGGSGNWQQKTNYSLPLAIITVSDGTITSIDQVFNGFGYIGSTVFALPRVKGLIPNGRNNDGTLKNIEYNRTSVRVDTFTITSYTGPFSLYSFQSYNGFQAIDYYDEKTNTMVGNYAGSFISGVGYLTNGVITSFTPKTTFHAVDYNDVVLKQDLATKPHIVETYVNGTSWYRVYSDGWCEQGANNQTSDTNGGYTVTFLKPFKNTNYNVTGMTVDCAGGTQCVKYTRKSAASISFYTTNNTQYSSMKFNWQACGYIS